MTMAVTRALAEGAEAIICASTGNTSASAAAYAARAGMRAYVVVPQGKIALGKLSQAVMHGARVVQIEGNFDQALRLVRDVKERYPTKLALVNSVNPHRIEGQKTAAFEICDALGRAPDYHLLPVGNAGNITAYWRGYVEYKSAGAISALPRMMGFEAAGAAPIVHGRVIDLIPIPGHSDVSVALYDRNTAILLAGDSLYPGRLYVHDFAAFQASTERMIRFTGDKPVSHILGNHIEQSSTPFLDYPVGTMYQPNEHELALSRGSLLELEEALVAMHGTARRMAMRVDPRPLLRRGRSSKRSLA